MTVTVCRYMVVKFSFSCNMSKTQPLTSCSWCIFWCIRTFPLCGLMWSICMLAVTSVVMSQWMPLLFCSKEHWPLRKVQPGGSSNASMPWDSTHIIWTSGKISQYIKTWNLNKFVNWVPKHLAVRCIYVPNCISSTISLVWGITRSLIRYLFAQDFSPMPAPESPSNARSLTILWFIS